ncbi:AIPR family protein [Pseudomonas aeruginosa]|uniref:AIPR family protein n=1 Tax=Pseudomonas aeruginosa TaxID=287 RepID=UPI001F317EC2|nr:AIPR family protein [Pseudomonas aeruginosa]UGW99556.1 AIPR family protein [Pseudomonas aeruginosa]
MSKNLLHVEEFNGQNQNALKVKFGDGKAHLIWVMSMYLDEPNAEQLGVDCLTDQPNDKKLDFVYLNPDERRLVFAQGYYTQKVGGTAPANKASDLNTAAAWLMSGDLDKVPEDIADVIRECRAALDQGEVDQIELVYVHNLTESKMVLDELETVRAHLQKGLGGIEIVIAVKEIGLEECERLFVARESGILVKDELNIPSPIIFEETGPNWRAALVSLPASWLYEQFHEYKQPLFSANYRGFLGVSKRRKINSQIKQTAESSPEDFWVFNNGITLLTLDYEARDGHTAITGCSIINGAQTTGSISQIDVKKHDLSNVRVLARVVACGHQETVRNIVRFNNTQNEITTWDQYSNTGTQKRIADEFTQLGHGYSLKRGFGQSITGLGIEVVAQPLLAFGGALEDAVRGKNTIFDRKAAYNRAFEGKSARHILFVYSLALAIDELRANLKQLNREGKITKGREKQLRIARSVRFKYFFMAVISAMLEELLERPVDVEHVSFTKEASLSKNFTVEQLANKWLPLVTDIFTMMATQITADPMEVLTQSDLVPQLAERIAAMVTASGMQSKDTTQAFIDLLG